MIRKGNKPILYFDVSCKLQIWEILLVIIINIKTDKRECVNTMFILSRKKGSVTNNYGF
jgi:hypothetical protein